MPTQNMYSTGEVAKICGITIRTVQYYDNRELVVPSGISEGGRRLYSNDDLAKMKIVCFLRDLNIPIKTVSEILKEKNSKKVISLLLKEQKLILQNEINEKENKLKILNGLEECLEDSLSEDLIERVNKKVEEMENAKDKKSLQKIRGIMIGVGIPLEIIEIATFILGLKTGIWWPFAIGMVLVIIGAIFISKFYFTKINYICPECNKVFKPSFKEVFWANHTPTTRKLTCPHCKIKSFCVETTREIDIVEQTSENE